jgi:hypothetical protein
MFTNIRPCLFTKSHGQARKRHIGNINKNLLHGPGFRQVNAVQLSLQSGRNTQLELVQFWLFLAAFERPLTRHDRFQ